MGRDVAARFRRASATGVVLLAGLLVLGGCGGGGEHQVVQSAAVDGVPACLTWPHDMLGVTYYALDPGAYDATALTHRIPDEPAAPGGADGPQPSAAWSDPADGRGTLYVYDDGVALFVADTGNQIWFSQQARTWDTVC